jgi:hypothetical protein
MPRSVMMYPRSLPRGDSEGSFLRVQLNVEPQEVVAPLRLYNDVVNLDLQVAPYLLFEIE